MPAAGCTSFLVAEATGTRESVQKWGARRLLTPMTFMSPMTTPEARSLPKSGAQSWRGRPALSKSRAGPTPSRWQPATSRGAMSCLWRARATKPVRSWATPSFPTPITRPLRRRLVRPRGERAMAEPLWTAREIAAALETSPPDSTGVDGVSIDSRTVKRGDIFFAIRGERMDGHRFAEAAVDKGAAAAVVDQAFE